MNAGEEPLEADFGEVGSTAPRAAAPPRLGIMGLGCIGGSIALRARALGVHVVGFDRPEVLTLATSFGMLDSVAVTFDELVSDLAILVLAVPPAETVASLARLAANPPARTIVLDVASVKGEIARAGSALPTFVPTHPIAGSERGGPGAASPELFAGRTWIVVPQGTPEARSRVRAFVSAMGAHPVEMAADVHDRGVARTSHLPQLVAVALAAEVAPALVDPALAALAGPGLASTIRLGASPWPLWREILAQNRADVARDLRAYAARCEATAQALEAGDDAALEHAFAEANAASSRTAALLPRPNAPAPAPVHSQTALPARTGSTAGTAQEGM